MLNLTNYPDRTRCVSLLRSVGLAPPRTRLVYAHSFPHCKWLLTRAATLPRLLFHGLAPPYQRQPLRAEPLHPGGKLCVLPHSSYLNPNLFYTDCRWRLPLWLLLFGVMVSVLTLSYLLTGTVYPNSWTRFSSESLDMLTASECFYHAGHWPPTIDDAASSMLELVSHSTPDRVFAQISKSGEITMAPNSIGRPSSCGPATLVDNTVRCALRCRVAVCSWFGAGFPARPGPHATRHTP